MNKKITPNLLDDLPDADIEKTSSQFSIVWLVPIIALILGLWLVFTSISGQGPTVFIQFDTADGLEPGKTKIRYRDVDVGHVEDVRFSEDLKNVLVTAELDPEMKNFLSSDTQFWVVRPRVGTSGVSGLGTLISGAFIQLDPGSSGKFQKKYVGLEEPPGVTSDAIGTMYRLTSSELGSVSMGSPIYFKQIPVGEVIKYQLQDNHEAVEMTIFIQSPHDQFIRKNTKFWNAAGFKFNLSSEGVNFEIESLISLLSGGIAFETPISMADNIQVSENSRFALYDSYEQTKQVSLTKTYPYLLYFDDTVRGLTVGASVEFRGIRVGTVKEISLARNMEAGSLKIPILIELEPERLSDSEAFSRLSNKEAKIRSQLYFEKLVTAGLRARLQTGNILTGQLYVDFEFFPEGKAASLITTGKYPEIPTVPRPLLGITQSVGKIMAKLERLPIEEIGKDAEKSMASIQAILSSPEVINLVKQLSTASTSINQLAATLNQQIPPLSKSLQSTTTSLETLVSSVKLEVPVIIKQVQTALTGADNALRSAEKLFASSARVVSPQGKLSNELLSALKQLTAAAKAIRLVADYLERHPEALIQGKGY